MKGVSLGPTEVVGIPKHTLQFPLLPTSTWSIESEGSKLGASLGPTEVVATCKLAPTGGGDPKTYPSISITPHLHSAIGSEGSMLGARGASLGPTEVVGTPKLAPTGGGNPKTYSSMFITSTSARSIGSEGSKPWPNRGGGQGVTNTLEPPACSLSIPGSLEPFWGPRKSPAHSPRSQLTPCTPLSIPGYLEPPRGLKKPPAWYPCSQLAPLTPSASLTPWNLPGASESPQLSPLAPSLLSSLPACSPLPAHSLSIPGSLEHFWAPGSPPACSPRSLSIPGSLEPSWGLRKPPAHSPCFQLAPLAPREQATW